MSMEIDPAAQAVELGIQFGQEEAAISGLLAAYCLLKSQPGVPEGAMAVLDRKLGSIASMIGEAIGMDLVTNETASNSALTAVTANTVPDHVIEQTVASTILALNRAQPDGTARVQDGATVRPMARPSGAARTKRTVPATPELADRPVAIELSGEDVALIDGHEVRLTKYDKLLLHALAFVNGDRITAHDLRLVARATTGSEISTNQYTRSSLVRLSKRISRALGYNIISGVDEEVSAGTEQRYGLVDIPGSTYVSDIEPPVSLTEVPYLVRQGKVSGSLFGGFINMENAPLIFPDNPIFIEVLSDNILYARNGREGRAVTIHGNNLFTANALLAIGGMVSRNEVEALAEQTGDADLVNIAKFSDYVDALGTLLGNASGRDVVLRAGTNKFDVTYGLSPDVLISDRRGSRLRKVDAVPPAASALETSETVRAAAVTLPTKIERVGDEPEPDVIAEKAAEPEGAEAGEAGDVKRLYNDVAEAYKQIGDAEEQSQFDVEALIADALGTEVSIVRHMLVLDRLGRELGVSLEPADDVDMDGFSAHVERVYTWADGLLRSVSFLNPRARLSELSIFAMHLGLPHEIPCLNEHEVTLPNRNASYAYASALIQANGLGFRQMHKILIAHESAIEMTYQRALAKVRAQLEPERV